MKTDKLIDAIGMIDDEYIQEAHQKKTKKQLFTFTWPNLLKVVSALACILLVITIFPRFLKSAPGEYSANSAAGGAYYEDGAAYAADSTYSNGLVNENAKSDEEGTQVALNANKKLILTSNLNLETQKIEDVINDLQAKINEYGAYVQQSSTFTRSNGTRIYEATIRIPADKYNEFIADTKQMGNPVSYSEHVDDVTDSYMDTEARLNSLKAQEERVLEFYKTATTIEDLMSIETRLSDLRYQIEYYESQIKNYDLLVAYSTLNISITETKVYTPTSTNFFTRLGRSFVNGFNDFISGVGDFVVDFVYNIWTIIFLVLLAFIAYKVYRFIRKKLNK